MVESRYWLQTLGCPKNQVDSDKLEGRLAGQGYRRAADASEADLVVVNTCAFIESARQESIDTVLELADLRRPGARLVVTGCMAERYGSEITDALPEVDLVAGFGIDFAPPRRASAQPVGVPVALARKPGPRPAKGFDLLELARPASEVPWAYVKVAEGCDRICGFCAIPSFRGKQRSRHVDEIMAEVELLLAGGTTPSGATAPPVREIVLVAQDLASYGRDRSRPGERVKAGRSPIAGLTRAISSRVARTRLLYLYPSGLTDELIEAVLAPACPTSTCRSSTCPAPIWPACAAGATASAFCGASPTSAPPMVRPASARRSFWGIPGRPSATTIGSWSSWPRPSWTGPGSSPFPTKREPTRLICRTRSRPRLASGAAARVRRVAGRDHGGAPRPVGRGAAAGAGGRPGTGTHGPRGTGDRRHRAPARRHGGR